MRFIRCQVMVSLVAVIWLQAVPLAAEYLRIGFSRTIIGDVNENDAMAVIKVWADSLVVMENLSLDPQTRIYGSIEDIKQDLNGKQVEFICITTPEYYHLQHLMDRQKFVVPVFAGSMTEEYVLLVRRKSPFSQIKDLRGGSLLYSRNSRTAVSAIWLDVQLAKSGFPGTWQFFSRVDARKKVDAAVLPVFFGKIDACLVTRKGFETMAELNPQISQQLRILAVSEKYVPNFLGFRDGYDTSIIDTILDRIKTWDKTTSGRQVLTIFQTESLEPQSYETIAGTMALIYEHRRLFGRGSAMEQAASGVLP